MSDPLFDAVIAYLDGEERNDTRPNGPTSRAQTSGSISRGRSPQVVQIETPQELARLEAELMDPEKKPDRKRKGTGPVSIPGAVMDRPPPQTGPVPLKPVKLVQLPDPKPGTPIPHYDIKKGPGRLARLPIWIPIVILVFSAYTFGTLSIVATQLFGISQSYGPGATYYFPILGGWALWPAWIMVLVWMGGSFLLGITCALMVGFRIRQRGG